MTFGAPTDPAYLRFLAGLKQVAADPAVKVRWRWHPKDGMWYAYPDAAWGLEDVGLPDTSPGYALQEEWSTGKRTWSVRELQVPGLYSQVQGDYPRNLGRTPGRNLVWGPFDGGDWRHAVARTGGGGGGGLDPACVKRINDVRAYERAGHIPHDEAQRQINAIVAECT